MESNRLIIFNILTLKFSGENYIIRSCLGPVSGERGRSGHSGEKKHSGERGRSGHSGERKNSGERGHSGHSGEKKHSGENNRGQNSRERGIHEGCGCH